MSTRKFWSLIPLMLLAAACSEAPKEVAKKKEPEKPPEPISGRAAFYAMFGAARMWAPDLQPLQCVSLPVEGVPLEPGKAGAWRCDFVSAAKGKLRSYTYSVVEAGGNLHKGVFHEPGEVAFNGARGQAKPFLMQALKIDTDEAYKTALPKAEAFVKKNPNEPMCYLLELTPRFPSPTWRVIWGPSVNQSKFSVFVDASTGAFLAKV